MRLLLTLIALEVVYKTSIRQHVRRAIGYEPTPHSSLERSSSSISAAILAPDRDGRLSVPGTQPHQPVREGREHITIGSLDAPGVLLANRTGLYPHRPIVSVNRSSCSLPFASRANPTGGRERRPECRPSTVH
jgi:hypothetical protein